MFSSKGSRYIHNKKNIYIVTAAKAALGRDALDVNKVTWPGLICCHGNVNMFVTPLLWFCIYCYIILLWQFLLQMIFYCLRPCVWLWFLINFLIVSKCVFIFPYHNWRKMLFAVVIIRDKTPWLQRQVTDKGPIYWHKHFFETLRN